MPFNPRTILIGARVVTADDLELAYQPDLLLHGMEVATSTHEAIEFFLTGPFDLCLISDSVAVPDLQALVADLKKVEGHATTVFALLNENEKARIDRAALNGVGVTLIVSPHGSTEDHAILSAALKEKVYSWELKTRIQDVERVIGLTLKELDKVSRERKRGRPLSTSKDIKDFIQLTTAFHDDVRKRFYDVLEEKTQDAKPIKASKVDVPEAVLSRKLPKLDKDLYHGASSRVWDVLVKKFGIQRPGTEPGVEAGAEAAVAASTEAVTESSAGGETVAPQEVSQDELPEASIEDEQTKAS